MIARILRRVSIVLASLADVLDYRGAHRGETIAEDEYMTRLARESRTRGK